MQFANLQTPHSSTLSFHFRSPSLTQKLDPRCGQVHDHVVDPLRSLCDRLLRRPHRRRLAPLHTFRWGGIHTGCLIRPRCRRALYPLSTARLLLPRPTAGNFLAQSFPRTAAFCCTVLLPPRNLTFRKKCTPARRACFSASHISRTGRRLWHRQASAPDELLRSLINFLPFLIGTRQRCFVLGARGSFRWGISISGGLGERGLARKRADEQPDKLAGVQSGNTDAM